MSNLHFQTYSDKHHQNSSGLCLADLNNAAVANASITNASIVTTTTVKSSRWFSLLVLLVLSGVFLSGCGQKGALYLVKDAPSNTDFILYEGNKVEGSNTAASQAKQAAEQQKIEEAAAAQPQAY